MRRFYAQPTQFQSGFVLLDADETRHLREVLRLREGANVRIFDGEGKEFLCVIEQINKKETSLEIQEEIAPPAPESDLKLTLAVALLKGEKFDTVVQKAVELGVTQLVPLLTKRCDIKIKDAKDIEKRTERWRKIALEAAKQSGRARLMRIETLAVFENFIETATSDTKILFAERGGENFSDIKAGKNITAITGAEGGWEDSEIETARAQGFQIITFGGRILRAETAAITVAGILQNHFGDLK
ncbi:MAG TPA: 16S rRNA (uracil(1498)-N(3))-methyltransferase [Pyrinomonadaceae bacterium]|jgi:16S rRNA (uracil1498-N3)-methyltransferase